MESVEVWIVRHGETTMNAGGLLNGRGDALLTELGRRQAGWLRPVLAGERFDSVWSSDLRRAVDTARLAWGEPRIDSRLREIDFGRLEGRPYDALPAEHKQGLLRFEDFRAPDGESLEELSSRVVEFLDTLEPGRHLVFTHGGVSRAVLRQVGPDRFPPNGSLLALDWPRRKLLFVRENQHAAAPSPLVRTTREARSGSGSREH